MLYYYQDYNYTSVLWKMKGNKSYIKKSYEMRKGGHNYGDDKKKENETR